MKSLEEWGKSLNINQLRIEKFPPVLSIVEDYEPTQAEVEAERERTKRAFAFQRQMMRDALGERRYRIMVMRFVFGKSSRKIAGAFQISKRAVNKHIAAIKERHPEVCVTPKGRRQRVSLEIAA